MDEVRRQSVIAEISALTDSPRLEPDEITRAMLAKFKNISLTHALHLLEVEVEREELTMRKVLLNGKWTNAYRQVAANGKGLLG